MKLITTHIYKLQLRRAPKTRRNLAGKLIIRYTHIRNRLTLPTRRRNFTGKSVIKTDKLLKRLLITKIFR
ncbi:hypothetical protein HanXRQr2_Chr12g0551731 [Helianthus annuus]|uniref:Uncharacterized protein n=1 Tax=Helianthus annuus TaxID=4232 RepID=A0A9K3MWY6_HELAN|nr:hypothetical protein HanXRQr2_Chr12g0551731 [Helianthus annuus]KAJ0863533.1 hypothetical protein HanPSC8_Chr12g0531181 [Helianthus annuus]